MQLRVWGRGKKRKLECELKNGDKSKFGYELAARNIL